MRKNTSISTSLFMCIFMCLSFSSLNAQSLKFKYFVAWEVMAAGPEFLTGTINNTLKPGACISFFSPHISSYKAPHFYTGIDFSISPHMFDPTPQEIDIIDQYVIVTTTTSQFGTSQKTEPIEDIQISRMSVGIPFGYKALKLDKKISFMMNITPTYYRFGNDLPGDDYDFQDTGFGISFKIGLDYKPDEGMYFRLSYSHGSIPAFELPLLDEIRSTSGPGSFGTLQLGLVFSSLDRKLLPK